jgi:hypothetical protein
MEERRQLLDGGGVERAQGCATGSRTWQKSDPRRSTAPTPPARQRTIARLPL